MKAWFITGTDTGVGKSLVAAALLDRLAHGHARVVGMKPVAAGATCDGAGRWHNEDVTALRKASSHAVDEALVNPYLLRAPASPHIASALDGVVIDIDRIVQAFRALQRQADAVVVEGAGGFRVPLTDACDGADLARALGLPVILVVGLRLGCLNHSALTYESIRAQGLRLAGWVANRIDPDMAHQDANIAWLATHLDAPCLGDLPYRPGLAARTMGAHLELGPEFLP